MILWTRRHNHLAMGLGMRDHRLSAFMELQSCKHLSHRRTSMTHYDPLDEQRKINTAEQWDQAVFRPHNMPTPRYLEGEKLDQYRKRLIDKARPLVSADLQHVKTDDIFGTGLDDYEKRFLEFATAETVRPTNVPEGQLKQVTRHDASGRPYYEWFGSPRAWLDTFAAPKRRLIGIRTETQRGYNPGNLG